MRLFKKAVKSLCLAARERVHVQLSDRGLAIHALSGAIETACNIKLFMMSPSFFKQFAVESSDKLELEVIGKAFGQSVKTTRDVGLDPNE